MLPPVDQIKAAIEAAVKGVTLTVEGQTLVVPSANLAAVCRFLKASLEFQMDHVANLTAVDYPPDRLDVVYHLGSMMKKHGPLALRVTLPRATPMVESLTPIYRGAEFQEREVFDLFGVQFTGHPDLRRILMWDGFDGHPMRKDYKVEDQDAPELPAGQARES